MNFKVSLHDYLSFMIPGILHLAILIWIYVSLSDTPDKYYQYFFKLNVFHFLSILLISYILTRIINPIIAPILGKFIKSDKLMNEAFDQIKTTYPMLNFIPNLNDMELLFYSGEYSIKGDLDLTEFTSADFLQYQNFCIAFLILIFYELFYFFYSGFIYVHVIVVLISLCLFIVLIKVCNYQLKKNYLCYYSKIISYVLKPEMLIKIKSND